MFWQHQPLGEPEPIIGEVLRKGRQHGGSGSGDLIQPLVVLAAIEVVGHRHAIFLIHDVSYRAPREDRLLLPLEGVSDGYRLLKGLIKTAEPPAVEVFGSGHPLVGR